MKPKSNITQEIAKRREKGIKRTSNTSLSEEEFWALEGSLKGIEEAIEKNTAKRWRKDK